MNLTFEQKLRVLWSYGFTVGLRDRRLNTDYPGSIMVLEGDIDTVERDYDLPTRDGANGPWCVVGDDLGELVDAALDYASIFENFGCVVADVVAGGTGVLPTNKEGN